MSSQSATSDEHRYFNIRRINDDDVIFQTVHRASDQAQLENAAARIRGYREIKHGSWTIVGEIVTSKCMFVVERAHVHLSIAQAAFLPGFIQYGFDKDVTAADIALIEEILTRNLASFQQNDRPAAHCSSSVRYSAKPSDTNDQLTVLKGGSSSITSIEQTQQNSRQSPSQETTFN